MTKALISLRGCAGWSAHLLVANPEDRFSHADAHITMLHHDGLVVCRQHAEWPSTVAGKPDFVAGEQLRYRSACASAKSDQRIYYYSKTCLKRSLKNRQNKGL